MAQSSRDQPGESTPRPRSRSNPRPTIRAVAERAEVAISTVSRVVNGGHASEPVRRRVQRAIRELGYTPSVAAQALVGRRSGSIGLAVNSSQSPWFSQILAGIEESLLNSRKSVLIASMMLTGEYDPSTVQAWIQNGRVDGIIMVRNSRRDQPLLDAARDAGVPVVLIAPDLPAPCSFTVRCNNLEAGRVAAKHLVELGHRKVAFSGGPEESVDTRMRLAGVREILQEAGLSLRDDHTWFGQEYGPDPGTETGKRILALPKAQRPSAVVLGNDPMALACMRTLLAQGVRIPDEISIVGFDGTPEGQLCWPGLTTVSQPTRQMAAHACTKLLDSIEAPDAPAATSTEYPVELIVRESTGPARSA